MTRSSRIERRKKSSAGLKGKTPSSTGKTAEAFADALINFLDLLHLDQVIVVGISAAGPTALQLADRQVRHELLTEYKARPEREDIVLWVAALGEVK